MATPTRTTEMIRSPRQTLERLVDDVTDRALRGKIESDRRAYAQALHHLAAALAVLPH